MGFDSMPTAVQSKEDRVERLRIVLVASGTVVDHAFGSSSDNVIAFNGNFDCMPNAVQQQGGRSKAPLNRFDYFRDRDLGRGRHNDMSALELRDVVDHVYVSSSGNLGVLNENFDFMPTAVQSKEDRTKRLRVALIASGTVFVCLGRITT